MERYQSRSGRWVVLLASTLILGLAGCGEQQNQQAQQMPPTAVEVTTLKSQPVDITETLAGRVTAYKVAEIRPQVNGIILKRFFKEGSLVKAGEKLYQIDPAIYKAQLANAEGQLAVAKANERSTRLRAERYRDLVKSAAVSQQDSDDAEAAWQQARAQIKVAMAAVENAQINLDYTTITAPITGLITRSTITEGALVSAQQANALATVRQLSPIYVDIQAPATLVLNKKEANGSISSNVSLKLEDNSLFTEQGKLIFAEANVDEGTGTVNVRARFDNKDRLLMPGLFVRAIVTTQHFDNALLAPQQGLAIQANGPAIAMVVNKDNKVEARKATLGHAVGNQWLIESGLEPGDRLIISGLQKVSPGAPVTPQEATSDTNSAQH